MDDLPIEEPEYPKLGAVLSYRSIKDITLHQGCVLTSALGAVYTRPCRTVEEAEKEADKLLVEIKEARK